MFAYILKKIFKKNQVEKSLDEYMNEKEEKS